MFGENGSVVEICDERERERPRCKFVAGAKE
jgi:hypothetical protein